MCRIILAIVLLSVATYSLSGPDVVWLSEIEQWDGWKDDVVKMKAARKTQPLAGYLHSEEVAWDAVHDPELYCLQDGRVLTGSLDGLKWEQVNAWDKGRKLLLCYDEERGATLLDPASGRALRVKMVHDGPHPVEVYVDSLGAQNTYDMMSSYYEGVRLLRIEIDRCVREVLALKHLPDEERENFIRLTKARRDYCEMQGRFGGKAMHLPGGTAAGPLSGKYSFDLHLQALKDLLVLYEDYRFYDQEDAEGSR